MEASDWIDLISNVGFPIVVTFYVLTRLEKKIDKLIEVVDRGLSELRIR